ncbi:hypothetical protein TUM18999_28160 [Pseudomonas tohonis]|uniref:DUF3509 domain-containing protein n=1 Tax=Pseudomonas tohonis TaxID=2725477 RepID=A0A6J4E5E3_9PSED|nr:hypothetical protein [Pseudomonas tohonis]BCG24625.1 hypothetical protein TUM18999_28160 [Pseudomonas tohonis]GJN52016.1 hypothetical protein TUM20286_17680 [Pseudomonas tohonis]
MNVCVREIIEAFPDREVTLTTRPDGRLSLTIVGAAQPDFHRVIDCDAVLSRAQVGSLIDQLVQDVRAGADSRQPGQGARWLARGLPTTAVVPPFIAARASSAPAGEPRLGRATC